MRLSRFGRMAVPPDSRGEMSQELPQARKMRFLTHPARMAEGTITIARPGFPARGREAGGESFGIGKRGKIPLKASVLSEERKRRDL